MIIPTIINAIGGKIIKLLFIYPIEYSPVPVIESPKSGYPISVPEPKSSLKTATIIKMTPYPIAFPNPSSMDGYGLFPMANASRRPIMMQLVIIKPTNTESFADKSGKNAAKT
jgi:hypothetical protein